MSKPRPLPQHPRRPLCEELEPRLLLSADAAGLLLDPSLVEDTLSPELAATHQLDVPDESSPDGEMQPPAVASRREIAFVDAGVENYEQIVEALRARDDAGFEVVVLDPDRSGIEQITGVLETRDGLDAVYVISEGFAGAVQLGDTWLDARTLDSQRDAIASWGDALGADADLLFYGCDVAAGSEGAAFVDDMGRLTGADVAASVDLTGSALFGGDWELEYATGAIEGSTALLADTGWQGALGVVVSSETVMVSRSRLLIPTIVACACSAVLSSSCPGIFSSTSFENCATFASDFILHSFTGVLSTSPSSDLHRLNATYTCPCANEACASIIAFSNVNP